MKIELMGSIQWDGAHRDPGEVIDVSDLDAAALISRGRAKKYERIVEAEPVVKNRSVGLENSDSEPKIVKRTYKRKTSK
jgi:hypothetical protein